MRRMFLVYLAMTAGPVLAQIPPPVDGVPATAGATTSVTTTALPIPGGAAAGPGTTLPVPLPGNAPGTITVVISPELLQWVIQALTAMNQQPPGGQVPGVPGLPPIAQPPFPGPGTPNLPPPDPKAAKYKLKKNEKRLAGFPLLVVKGKKLIRTGPGLAQAMAFIQAGDQPSAVNVLGQTLSQIVAATQKHKKLKPGKQAAATSSAYNIGVQTMPPGAVPAAPTSALPAAPVSSVPTDGSVTLNASPTSLVPPAVVAGQGAPPPDGKLPPPLPPGPLVPPDPDKQPPLVPPDPGKEPPVLPPVVPPVPPKEPPVLPPIGLPPTPVKPVGCNPAFANAVAGAQKQASPLVLDLNGNGVADVTSPDVTGDTGAFNPKGAVRFDLSGKGETVKFEWLKPDADGLLVLDSNSNGTVDNATELFGDAEGFNDGYSKLALLDRDRSGYLSGEELSKLSVWVDDGDGVSEPGELRSLSSLEITRIDVRHQEYRSSFVRGGKTFSTWDWFPRSE